MTSVTLAGDVTGPSDANTAVQASGDFAIVGDLEIGGGLIHSVPNLQINSDGNVVLVGENHLEFYTTNPILWADTAFNPVYSETLAASGVSSMNYVNTVTFVRFQHNSVTKFSFNGTGIGFYAAAPVAQPTITGSRLANPALASLLTALALQGLIVDGTTA